jgi:glutaredoxin|tara:strand:- start:295 stop:612 length:318 start_codon:yes stop_codon:yes gene_type:complete
MHDRDNVKRGVYLMLVLYTQDRCGYCVLLKNKLKDWGHSYTEKNITYDAESKEFIRNEGHKTVPQLYYNDADMLKGDSVYLTEDILNERMTIVAGLKKLISGSYK